MEEVLSNPNKKWFVISILVVILVFLFFGWIYYYFNFPAGNVILKQENLGTGFIFSKNTNFAVYNTGGVSVFSQGVTRSFPMTFNVLDLNSKKSYNLPNSADLIGNYKIYSPSGKKILYPGPRLDDKYPGAALNTPSNEYNYFPYYELYIYDTNTKESMKITNKKEDLMYTYYFPSFYAWIDENSVVYRCRPDGGNAQTLSNEYYHDEYNLSTYCIMNLSNGLIQVQRGPPQNFYDGEIDVFKGKDSSPTRFTLPAIYGTTPGNCLPNFDGSMCIYQDSKFRVYESSLLFELILKRGDLSSVIYRGRNRPGAVYWTKDDGVYIVLGNELRKIK